MAEVKKFWEFDAETGKVVEVEREVPVRGLGAMKPIGRGASYAMPKPPLADDLDGPPVYGKGPPKDAA